MQMFEQMGKQIKVFWILVKLKIRFFGVVMAFENLIIDETILK